jgi:tRNA modification GTPase
VSAARPDDTIAAVATAPGRGALAIVRMSGGHAHEIGQRCVTPWPTEPRRATLARVTGADGDALDEGIAIQYRAPESFTGEDVLEFTCHGGPIVAATILAAFIARGARPAEPGEFTRRAVLNGKLDLIQAEAVGDLVDATSRSAQRVAVAQLDGGLSRRIASLREAILGLEALAAYDIDFPEEDDGPVAPERIVAATRGTIADIEALLATAPAGELVREGAIVVIAGAPNAGKSSLFNALLGRRRAIVTEIPGTTRDAIEAVTEAGAWPIRLIDTAGLRETSETVERLGIEVSHEYLERADVVLVCGDSDASARDALDRVATLTQAPRILVRTKADLDPAAEKVAANAEGLAVSAETGAGLAALAMAIARTLSESRGALRLDAPVVTRERHRVALTQARDELAHFLAAFSDQRLPAVVAAVHLREATRHLEELIGTVDVEDLLDRLFRTFCVGK